MTKTKIALAAALFAATSSAAFAQFDSNTANRYPGYAGPAGTLQSAPVRLQKQRSVAQPVDTAVSTGQSEFDTDRFDRASSPYAGGN
jgi:hypothetical protein